MEEHHPPFASPKSENNQIFVNEIILICYVMRITLLMLWRSGNSISSICKGGL